jgi:hypothetical protein
MACSKSSFWNCLLASIKRLAACLRALPLTGFEAAAFSGAADVWLGVAELPETDCADAELAV